MKKAKQSKVVGLGWANRAVSGKSRLPVYDEGLRRIAEDLVASIEMADKSCLRRQTLHMSDAIANYREWKRENNV